LKDKYVVWKAKYVPNSFVLDKMSFVEDTWEIVEGIPRSQSFPSGVTHTVSQEYPNDMLLVDVFRSPHRMILISPALKDFFEKKNVKQVEYLPVAILNHKGKPADDYFILHPIHPVECLNIKESEAKWDYMDDTTIGPIKQIIIDETQVDPELQIFKIKYLYDIIIVRRDLAEAIDALGATGIEWIELHDFGRG
jgi:hypothetical protein